MNTDLDKLRLEHSVPARLNLPWHLTASAVVIEQGHILLVHHKRIGAWLPPGGHPDNNELPFETAVRETLEETGIRVVVLAGDVPIKDDSEAFFSPQPLCQHVVHAVEKGAELYHVDVAFLCALPSPMSLPEPVSADEVHGARWHDLKRLSELPLAKNVPEIVDLAVKRLARLSSGG